MMARRKRLMLVAGLVAATLCVALAGLVGCKDLTFNGDMKGYLEYWTDTVGVADARWSAEPASQTNSSGRATVATNATVRASVTISNPEGYPLESVVSSASDGPHSVEVSGPASGAVLGLTRVTAATPTSLAVEVSPFSQVPTPASLALEHTDFTVKVSPTRSDNALQPSNPLILSLRYNTPPRMPVEVVYNDKTGKLERLGGDKWELVQGKNIKDLDGNIYWAYPSGIKDTKNPDYVASFQIYENGALEIEDVPSFFSLASNSPSLISLVSSDLAGYDVYAAPVSPGVEISVYAVDIEGVKSQGTVSDKAPHQIILNGNGGLFDSSKGSVTVYKADGSTINGGDLDIPDYPGLSLSGWSEQPSGGSPITFPHTVSSPLTLYAQWRGNTYTVTFNDNSGTGGPGSLTAAYNQAPPPLPSRPTKDGYTFAGYWTQQNGGGTQYYDANGDAQGIWKEMANTVLYARWDSVYQEPNLAGGKYEVSNHEHLLWISQQARINNPSVPLESRQLKLAADIDVPDGQWTPFDFGGWHLDGQGYSIEINEDWSASPTGSQGLFTNISGATVENLVLKGSIKANVADGQTGVGAVVGASWGGTIRNVMSCMDITNTNPNGNAGGLVGYYGQRTSDGGPARIENCAVYANVTSGYRAGGLVGCFWGGWQVVKVSNSVYMGTLSVSPGTRKGAVAGGNQNGNDYSTLTDIYYCAPSVSKAIGADSSTYPARQTNVVSKTEQEIASTATANLLGNQWEYKAGEKYPTLKKNP